MKCLYVISIYQNIKTCDKYDASSSVNEYIKTYFNDGGEGEKIQKLLIFTTILGRENTKALLSRPFFFFGGGGGEDRVMRRNKVLTFHLKTNGRENDCLLGSFS